MSETQGKLFDVEYRSSLFAWPVKAMRDRGWINVPNLGDLPRVKAELLRVMGVETLEQLEELANNEEAFLRHLSRPSGRAAR